jgi:hypothetical protein
MACTGEGGLGRGVGAVCVMRGIGLGGGSGFSGIRVMGAMNWYTTSVATRATGVVCSTNQISSTCIRPVVTIAGHDARWGGSIGDNETIIGGAGAVGATAVGGRAVVSVIAVVWRGAGPVPSSGPFTHPF